MTGLAAACLTGTLRPTPVEAQLQASPALAAPADTDVVLDTVIRPGWQAFESYTTPGLCLAAAHDAARVALLAVVDSAAHQPERDTLPTAAVATAHRCGAHFTVATVAPVDLLDLAHLALIVGDDTTARAAADRYVASITDPVAHRWALFAVDTMYLHATPMRLAAAESTTARLDSLGPAAALQRRRAHGALKEYAASRFDPERMKREGLAYAAVCRQLSAADQQDVDGSACIASEVAGTVFFAELYLERDKALANTRRLLEATGFQEWDQFLAALRGIKLEWAAQQVGKPVPPLKAAYWVGAPAGARTWPVPGKVSIFVHGVGGGEYDGENGDKPETMALWQRLAKQYGDRLNITVLVSTRGSFRNGPPLTPAAEAERLGKFYREQLGLPVTVAVEETPVTQLPPPDGRILRGEPPLAQDPYYGLPFMVADRAGKFLLYLPNVMGYEPMLDAWIARAVQHDH